MDSMNSEGVSNGELESSRKVLGSDGLCSGNCIMCPWSSGGGSIPAEENGTEVEMNNSFRQHLVVAGWMRASESVENEIAAESWKE